MKLKPYTLIPISINPELAFRGGLLWGGVLGILVSHSERALGKMVLSVYHRICELTAMSSPLLNPHGIGFRV